MYCSREYQLTSTYNKDFYHCNYHRLFTVICLSSFGIKEPDGEQLCKTVLTLINTYQTPCNVVTYQSLPYITWGVIWDPKTNRQK